MNYLSPFAQSKKGEILKIKFGYNPNCSGNMWLLWLLLIGGPILGTIVLVTIIVLLVKANTKRRLKKQQILEGKEIS